MSSGALGIKVMVSGRLGGAEIARSEWLKEGRIPLHTFRADISYGFTEAMIKKGKIGVKVWIFKRELYRKTDKDLLKEAELVDKETGRAAGEVKPAEEPAKSPEAKEAPAKPPEAEEKKEAAVTENKPAEVIEDKKEDKAEGKDAGEPKE